MASESDWVPFGVDTKRANMARVYDYLLGGTHNFMADQDIARTLIAIEPATREIARANRDFLDRAIRVLAASGVRQFIDIGSGIPTQGNVHEIAERAAPGSKVVYVDVDPVVIAHSRALLSGNQDAVIIEGDLREPGRILGHETTRRLIDFTQPTGLIMAAVLHFIPDSDDPRRLVAELAAALAPGSHVVISHGTNDDRPEIAAAAEKAYNRNVTTSGYFRSGSEITRFFDGLDLLDPGVVKLPYWRPDPPGVPANAARILGSRCGVARKR